VGLQELVMFHKSKTLLETVEKAYNELYTKSLLQVSFNEKYDEYVEDLNDSKPKTMNDLISECIQKPWIGYQNQSQTMKVVSQKLQNLNLTSLLTNIEHEIDNLKEGKYTRQNTPKQIREYQDLLSLSKITLEQNIRLLDAVAKFRKKLK
jgi:hypothetical protein